MWIMATDVNEGSLVMANLDHVVCIRPAAELPGKGKTCRAVMVSGKDLWLGCDYEDLREIIVPKALDETYP